MVLQIPSSLVSFFCPPGGNLFHAALCCLFRASCSSFCSWIQGLARLKVWVRRMSRQIRNVHANDVAKLLVECFLHLDHLHAPLTCSPHIVTKCHELLISFHLSCSTLFNDSRFQVSNIVIFAVWNPMKSCNAWCLGFPGWCAFLTSQDPRQLSKWLRFQAIGGPFEARMYEQTQWSQCRFRKNNPSISQKGSSDVLGEFKVTGIIWSQRTAGIRPSAFPVTIYQDELAAFVRIPNGSMWSAEWTLESRPLWIAFCGTLATGASHTWWKAIIPHEKAFDLGMTSRKMQ